MSRCIHLPHVVIRSSWTENRTEKRSTSLSNFLTFSDLSFSSLSSVYKKIHSAEPSVQGLMLHTKDITLPPTHND